MNVSIFPPCRPREHVWFANSGTPRVCPLFILDRCERSAPQCGAQSNRHKNKARGVYPFAHFNPALFLFHLVALRVPKFADCRFQLWVCKCVHATQSGMAMLNASRCGGLAFYAPSKMGVL